MNRKEAFAEVARLNENIADHCRGHKDTVGWWREFGRLMKQSWDALSAARPKNDKHQQAWDEAFQPPEEK